MPPQLPLVQSVGLAGPLSWNKPSSFWQRHTSKAKRTQQPLTHRCATLSPHEPNNVSTELTDQSGQIVPPRPTESLRVLELSAKEKTGYKDFKIKN